MDRIPLPSNQEQQPSKKRSLRLYISITGNPRHRTGALVSRHRPRVRPSLNPPSKRPVWLILPLVKIVDSPKKRKATGPHQAAPPPNQRRSRSPPFSQQSNTSVLSNPPPGRRRGHSRQRSDISAYRSAGRSRGDAFAPHGGFSPGVANPVVGTSRETTFAEPYQHPRTSHSVSSMLSDQPSSRYPPDSRATGHQSEGGRRSRATSEERARGPPPPPPAPARHERSSND